MHAVTALAPVELSKTARLRLKWFEFCDIYGDNVSLTCRHFGIGRQTFYRWRAATTRATHRAWKTAAAGPGVADDLDTARSCSRRSWRCASAGRVPASTS